jgi:hypothetical protein
MNNNNNINIDQLSPSQSTERIQEHTTERIHEHTIERIPEQTTERIQEHTTEHTAEQELSHAQEHTEEQIPGHTPEHTAEQELLHTQEHTAEQIPGRTQEHTAEQTTDREDNPLNTDEHPTTATSLIFQFHIPNRNPTRRNGETDTQEQEREQLRRSNQESNGVQDANGENLRRENGRRESYPVAIIFEFASPVPISLMSEFLLTLNSGPNLLNFLRGRLFPPNASDDDILNLLFQQHQPQTPPPASKRFIETCPIISITNPDSHDLCLVCQDSYQIGDEALKLPCKHLYHKDCLIPWLQSRNTCPTCRFALPVDEDEDKSKCGSNNEANTEGSRSESVSERNA